MLALGPALGPALGLAGSTLAAQGTERVIAGRVIRPGNADVVGVPSAWVVLHRVGTDRAGPLDSMRTRGDGSYRFRYRPSGDTSAVYFVSTSRGGVAYFTPPLHEPTVRDGAAELLVYDTTSTPIPITVRGRHVIITAPDSADGATRNVVEVYELSNEASLMRVAGRGTTFEAPLPPGVSDAAIGDGDISANAMRIVDGRVLVTAPLAPGMKQFSFFYQVPVTIDAIAYGIESDVPVLEVLIEDARGTATGAGLVEVSPVQVDGRPFKRFLAQNVPDSATFRVAVPGGAGQTGLRMMLVVTAVGAAMLLGLGMAFLRQGPAALTRRRDVDPEKLAVAVVALDSKFERIASPTEAQRARHYVARAQLKGRLSAALAKRDGLA